MPQFFRHSTEVDNKNKPQEKDPILQLAEIFLAINEREHIVDKITFAKTEDKR